jgi:hypothetical protein
MRFRVQGSRFRVLVLVRNPETSKPAPQSSTDFYRIGHGGSDVPLIVGRGVDVANELGDVETGDVNVGTVGVVTVGDGVTDVDDGLPIVGDVLNVDGDVPDVGGDVLSVDGDVLKVDGDVPRGAGAGPAPTVPVVPVTPLRPVDDNVVLVGDAGVEDEPIELVGAGIVDGEIVGDVDGTGDVDVVGGLGDVMTGDVRLLVVPTLGLDMVPGPGMQGSGAVIGADCVDVAGLIGSVLPA